MPAQCPHGGRRGEDAGFLRPAIHQRAAGGAGVGLPKVELGGHPRRSARTGTHTHGTLRRTTNLTISTRDAVRSAPGCGLERPAPNQHSIASGPVDSGSYGATLVVISTARFGPDAPKVIGVRLNPF
jgi:hypothetical protein